MSDVLTKICATKSEYVAEQKTKVTLEELKNQINHQSAARGFYTALKSKSESGLGVIAEIKKASPSKGLIREDFDPPSLAASYEKGGAACLSVLTDQPYFQGSDDYLKQARSAASLPVLRKDFMIDLYQVYESRAMGADCILLIMAALSDGQAQELESLAMELGMDVLVEIHNEAECERALKLSSPLIGVNNRNLKTLEVDLVVTKEISPMIPSDRLVVCESGLYTHQDLASMAAIGVRSFLIGESLMRQENVEMALKTLISGH